MFTDARKALRVAATLKPSVIAWQEPKGSATSGWVVYHPSKPIFGTVPEILCLPRVGFLPLTETGEQVLQSALRAL